MGEKLYCRMKSAAFILRGTASLRDSAQMAARRLHPQGALSDKECLEGVAGWLLHAQDANQVGGVSAGYCLKNGWLEDYPETSGYLIPTFLALAKELGRQDFAERALEIGDWELATQAPSGGVPSSPLKPSTRAFNTGQVMLGLCVLWEHSQDTKFLDAAAKAGEYLLRLQEPDGRWERDTYCGARTYHSRVAWALLRLGKLRGEERFATAARENLAWVMSKHLGDGLFSTCGFNNDIPITHTIIYTLRGLLESKSLSPHMCQASEVDAALDAATKRLANFAAQGCGSLPPGLLPAAFGNGWKPDSRYSCLTGDAQAAILLYRFSQESGDSAHAVAADTIVEGLKRTLLTDIQAPGARFGVAGSWPLDGAYMPFAYINWAAKFLCDALLLKLHWKEGLRINA